MKKLNLYAIVTLAIVILAFQSCKKDDELTRIDNTNTEAKTFNPYGINDMNAYLSDFIKTMKSPTKDNASLPLEDAEWHLTACLNYKMCNANADRRDMIYDTIITKIHVDNNSISMTDINNSFVEISKNVGELYNSYDMEGKQIVYIYSTINSDNTSKGDAEVRTIMATGNRDPHYYFSDWDYICLDTLFPDNVQHHWRDAANTLEDYVNLFGPGEREDGYYYVSIAYKDYHFRDYSGSVVNGICYDSRLFYRSGFKEDTNPPYLSKLDMMFYLDSYLGLVMNETMRGTLIGVRVFPSLDEMRDLQIGDLAYHNLQGTWGHAIQIGDGDNGNSPSN